MKEDAWNRKTRMTPRNGRAVRVTSSLVLAAALLIFGWATWTILTSLLDDARSAVATEALQSYTACITVATESSPDDKPGTAEGALVETEMIVDFQGLQAMNPDICGWIRIPGTNISQPIVQGSDNEYYLSHGADGSASRAGAIFIDSANARDFSDPNTILYGHRMNNGTMFAELLNYTDRAFLQAHPWVYISWPGGELRCRIFEVSEVPADSSGPAYRTHFENAADFARWSRTPVGAPHAFQDAALAPTDKVVTLSTCVRGNGALRFVLRAKMEKED